jgi:hypothetical protein
LRAALDSTCLKALAKRREDRYATALDFARAIGGLTRSAPPSPSIGPPGLLRGGLRAALLASLLVALLAAGLMSFSHRSPPPPVLPGEDLALLAASDHAAGHWTAFRSTVSELERRAPAHPRIPEYQRALSTRTATIEQGRKAWSAALERWSRDPLGAPSADLRMRIHEFPEIEEEARTDFRTALGRLETSLLEESRQLRSKGPNESWRSPELKSRAASLRAGMAVVIELSTLEKTGVDLRMLSAELPLLDGLIAYRGTWNIRINIRPFAEFRILAEDSECARDFTPAAIGSLDIAPRTDLELGWPSLKDPKIRWRSRLPAVDPGGTLVVSGDLERSDIRLEKE